MHDQNKTSECTLVDFKETESSEREKMQKLRVKTMRTVFFMLKVSLLTNFCQENRL
jgi:hypothetical protein